MSMRILRRVVHALVIVVMLVVGATAAAVIVSQTAWFKNWLRAYIESQANQYLNGQLSIGRLGGNLFFGVELENVGVSMDGSQIVSVKDVGLDYSVFEFISGGVSLDEIRLNQPTLYLRRDGDTWSISRLVKQQAQEADREGPQLPIAIAKIGVSDASIVIDEETPVGTAGEAESKVRLPQRIDRIDAEMSFAYEPVRYSLEVAHVSFRASDPSFGLNGLSGRLAVRDDTIFVDGLSVRTEESSMSIDGAVQDYTTSPRFNFRVSSDKLSVPEIARVLPALTGVQLQPAFEVNLDGPLDRLGVEMNVRSSAGQLTGRFVADVQEPGQAVKGEITVRHLDLSPIVSDPGQKSDITANARVDVAAESFARLDGLRGTLSLDAPRIAAAGYSAERLHADARLSGRRVSLDARGVAYGADATATGHVTLPAERQPLSYDLRGRVRNVDLRRLPRALNVPPAETVVTAAYRIHGRQGRSGQRPRPLRAEDAVIGAMAGEVRFDRSTVAGARIAPGSTARFSMDAPGEITYGTHVTVSNLDLQRLGREFNVPALAADRFNTNLNGHIGAEGRSASLESMKMTAEGTLTDSMLFGGRLPELSFRVVIAGDTADLGARGSFAEFDPAVASGRPAAKGSVAGALDVNATISRLSTGVTADNIAGSVRVTLEPSTIGGLAISGAHVDADYRERSAEIRQFDVTGRDLNVTAKGTLALNHTGQSHVAFQIDSPSLEEVGKIVDAPLAGIAKVEGTVTGNRTELQASGALTGSGIKYGDNGALSADGTYAARVPDLAFAQAVVESKLDATFVSVGGQEINQLAARIAFAEKQMQFDATAEQRERTLEAAGTLRLHPEHQEVHLDRLQLDARGQQWQLAADGGATVRYGNETIAVENVRLTSGAQAIAADGRFGRGGDALTIELTSIDLASVDALLLRPPQLSGRLDGSATVTGTAGDPKVEGSFAVANGGFRDFKYDALRATVGYRPSGIDLDARLQQNPAQWITARGHLPAALFSRPEGTDAGSPRPGDPIDIAIDSSPLDVGIVQGFTTAVTDAAGTFEAHVRVTGTADDPRPAGEITIQDGALTVEPVGVRYTNIAGRVELEPERVRIPLITVLDNHDNALTVVGDLAVRQRRVGAVEMYVNAHDFKVLDNEMGEVRIQSALEIGGELRAPQILGYLGVTSGNINLDRILALAGTSPYPTRQTEFETEEAEIAATPEPPQGVFGAARADVYVTVPGAFVVRADSLQAPGSTVNLGALNVTLGGDLRAMKEPGGRVRLIGAVNTVRGSYDFQGRRFEILRDGTIRFAGLDELNPLLDLRTRRIIQGVEARVNIRGTLRQPELELSSTPPLEEADILSLIVFNQPINQLGEGQQISLAARAQSLAVGAVAGQLAQSIGNALDLDTFEIDIPAESGGTPEVTIGQQVGANLYLKVQQGIGDETSTNFILEYELLEWLRLQSNFVQGTNTQSSMFRRREGSGADLKFFFSY
jgi:autotransporter translocation and assembly factor TamB